MLQFWHLKRLVQIAFLVGLALATLTLFLVEPSSDSFATIVFVGRFALPAVFAILFLSFVAWRLVPLIQRAIFPYLGGSWAGVIKYDGAYGRGTKPVSVQINHTLVSLQLLMETDESMSETVFAHAEKMNSFDRYRLYYVYKNSRRAGLPNPAVSYRGLAILEVRDDDRLEGHYFTEASSKGNLALTRITRHPPWQFLR